jgi:hypothetical protein
MSNTKRVAIAGIAAIAAVTGGAMALAAVPGVGSAQQESNPIPVVAPAAVVAAGPVTSLDVWAREQLERAKADLEAARALQAALGASDDKSAPATTGNAQPTAPLTSDPGQGSAVERTDVSAVPAPAPAPSADATTGASGGQYGDDEYDDDDDEYDEYDDDDDDDDDRDDDDD